MFNLSHVDEKFLELVPEAEEYESDMIDLAYEPKKNSRLGCQINLNHIMNGITFEIPNGYHDLH